MENPGERVAWEPYLALERAGAIVTSSPVR